MADPAPEIENWFSGPLPPKSGEEPKPPEMKPAARPAPVLDSESIAEIDSGLAFSSLMEKYTARIRQLKIQVDAFKKENTEIVNDIVNQNLELLILNQQLEAKVKERTQNLELSRAQLERQTRELQELGEAKEALTHMIVHDMKNPLAAISGTLRLFTCNTFGLEPDIHALLLGAVGHAQRLLEMIEEILMISRMQDKEFQLKPETADLIVLARRCLDLMSQTRGGKQLEFRLAPGPSELPWVLDAQIIERVINNLLSNAIKYAPDRSEITVAVTAKKKAAVVSVTNWGQPIPPRHQERIFDMFCRVRAEDSQFSGTGLGLTFCQLAVNAHGGRLGVVSPVPPHAHGACFHFTLPKKQDRSQPPPRTGPL